MKTNKILMAGALALSMVLSGGMLTGCSNSSTKDTKATEVAKKEVKTLGKKTKDSKSLKLTNNTGKKITVFETKSNSSESKKHNTASTSSSSNKNNSSSNSSKPSSKPSNSSSNNSGSSKPSNNSGSNSSSSKPAEHKHDWVAQYKTVNVPEKGHNEQVLVKDAWDEQVPIKEMKEFTFCSTCGANITGHAVEHLENSLNCQGYYTDWREVTTGYNTVHHEAVYETRYIVDSPATTKQELTGYKCSSCGKTKAN